MTPGSAAPAEMTTVEVVHEPLLPARARVDLLCDEGSFHATRSSAGDGVLCGLGRVEGRPVYVWSQNVKHKGGSLGQAGGATIVATIEAAEKAGAPVVGFLHSGGARLQEGIGALGAYASIFRATSRASVPQISVICGPCAGGAAYSPSLGTLVMMIGEESQMFLTGPRVIAKVTREIVTGVELGGHRVHRKAGVSHIEAVDDAQAASLIRQALSYFPGRRGGPLPVRDPRPPLPGDPSAALPTNPRLVYDIRDVTRHLLDAGEFLELSTRYAKNLVVGFGRIDGHPVGIIANQPRYLGGVLDAGVVGQGRVVREHVRPLRDPARRADRHARLPARRAPGARGGAAPRGRAAARVRGRGHPAGDGDPATGVRWCIHRHELPRPRT